MIRKVIARTAALGGLGSYGYYMYINYEDARAKEAKTHVPPFKMMLYRWIPVNAMTRLAGRFAEAEIPSSLRFPVFGLYSKLFGCSMEESLIPLDQFNTFQDFFTRSLRSGSRPVDVQSDLVCPSDGKILAMGSINPPFTRSSSGETMVFPEQIKGVSYALKDLVTPEIFEKFVHRKDPIYYCTIYLAPGDYHRFHSPTEWKQTDAPVPIPGEVLSVAPYMMRWVKQLLCVNVRTILAGSWKYGNFTMIPVGATNVSSIEIEDKLISDPRSRHSRGDPIGMFKMGSTVVLLFNAPPNFQWAPSVGDRVRMGAPLGAVPKTYRFINGIL